MDELNQSYNSSPEITETEVTEQIEDTEEQIEEIDELAEQMAVQSIISEERHEQILEEVERCQQGLNELRERTQQVTTMESPQLSQIAQDLQKMNERLAALEAALLRNLESRNQSNSLDSSLSNQQPNLSGSPPNSGEGDGQELNSSQPVSPPREAPRRRRRIL